MLDQFYAALKQQLKTEVPELKKIGLWNNQYKHLLMDRPNEDPIWFPSVFIELKPNNYKDLGMGVQEFDLDVCLHLGFDSFKDDDLKILQIKQRVFSAAHRFQFEYYTMLLRRDEDLDVDHPSVQVYMCDYHCTGKDYTKDTRNKKTATFTLSATTAVSLTGFTN